MYKYFFPVFRRRFFSWVLFLLGLGTLLFVGVLLRLTMVTDYLYHSLVKDPVRISPTGPVMVSPADGTVLYIKKIKQGIIPEVVKQGVSVPIVDHLKMDPVKPMNEGYLIGIFMNTQGVHINRAPDHGIVKQRHIFNGPHMDMTSAERVIILSQLFPGMTTLKKALGMPPFDISNKADYILKSARETLLFEDPTGRHTYLVRIADFYVGRILTWVKEGQPLQRGEKIGMITWGSQTDILFESTPEMKIKVEEGQYVYGGETILATY